MKYIFIILVLALTACKTTKEKTNYNRVESEVKTTDSTGLKSTKKDSAATSTKVQTQQVDSSSTRTKSQLKIKGDSVSYNINTGEIKVKNGAVELDNTTDSKTYQSFVQLIDQMYAKLIQSEYELTDYKRESEKKYNEAIRKEIKEKQSKVIWAFGLGLVAAFGIVILLRRL